MRPTLQTVPENCPATANQTSSGATVQPSTPNGNREPAAEKATPTSNTASVTQEIKAPHPPQSQQLQAVKPRNSSRVSNLFNLKKTLHSMHFYSYRSSFSAIVKSCSSLIYLLLILYNIISH